MRAVRHCWWCGQAAEVDTEVAEPQNGLVKDQEPDSWICAGPCVMAKAATA